MQHVERLVGLFVEAHPRPMLDRMLSFLGGEHGALGALIAFRTPGDDVVIEAVRSLRPGRTATFEAAWRDHGDQLRAGEVVQAAEYVLAPLPGKNGIVGVLYLDRPAHFRREGLDVYLIALAKGLVAAIAEPVETGAGIGVDERAVFRAVLERYDWNIARVARELGVTRRTIYLRMGRFGISRKHVPILKKRL